MSSCGCEFGHEVLGARVSGPHIARKDGHRCGCCFRTVKPGQRCIDIAGIYADGHKGFFVRMHALCSALTQRFKVKVCGYEEYESLGCESLVDMAEHAFAEGDDPFWKDWLLIYEMTWEEQE